MSNAETNNVIATTLIGFGGFLVSYATFTGKAAEIWANVAAGCLLSGIAILLAQSIRRWQTRLIPPEVAGAFNSD